MRKIIISLAAILSFAGCAEVCSFGRGDAASGVECRRTDAKVEAGMTAKQVEDKIGPPQRRNIDVAYRGKTYDEVWIYETSPTMLLYFKHGVLEAKDYQQY